MVTCHVVTVPQRRDLADFLLGQLDDAGHRILVWEDHDRRGVGWNKERAWSCAADDDSDDWHVVMDDDAWLPETHDFDHLLSHCPTDVAGLYGAVHAAHRSAHSDHGAAWIPCHNVWGLAIAARPCAARRYTTLAGKSSHDDAIWAALSLTGTSITCTTFAAIGELPVPSTLGHDGATGHHHPPDEWPADLSALHARPCLSRPSSNATNLIGST